MANTRIPQLTPAISLNGTEELEVARPLGTDPETYESLRVTADQIAGLVPATGTVTSVGLGAPDDFTVGGSPVTVSGTLDLAWAVAPTGTGAMVRANSPTLVTPALGTPSAAVLTNATGLPLNSGVVGNLPVTNLAGGSGASSSSFWRGDGSWAVPPDTTGITSISIASANGLAGTSDGDPATPTLTLSTTVTGILSGDGTTISAASVTGTGDVVLATSPALVTPDLGTPSAAVLTNATGLPLASGVTGNLAVSHLNSGTNASSSTFWRGDGTWAVPAGGGGGISGVAVATANGLAGTSDGDPSTPTLTLSTSITGFLRGDGTAISAATIDEVLNAILNGGGSAIAVSSQGDLYIPFTGTIVGVTMLADQSGSIVVDIWKDTYANYPPTIADSITGAAPPTITTAVKSQDNTLTGWTTAVTAGDTLRFNVNSCSAITRCNVALIIRRS